MKKTIALALLGLMTAFNALAWPDKPVTLVVPFPPGGSTDVIARILAPRLQEKLGGQIDASFQNINAVVQHIHGGKLRALAVTSGDRNPLLPQVPTLNEAGFSGVQVASWQGVVAPKGLPVDLRRKLHAALISSLQEDSIRTRLVSQGFEIVANTPEQFAQYQAAEFARWKTVIEVGRIAAD